MVAVMARRVPAIHDFDRRFVRETWVTGTRLGIKRALVLYSILKAEPAKLGIGAVDMWRVRFEQKATFLKAAAFFFLSLGLSVASDSALSANIVKTDNKLCAFALDGDILAGDSDVLNRLLHAEAANISENYERSFTICLKSNGGSFTEGLKIAELIYNQGISTLVEYGAQCFSACATIFMAGVSHGREFPYRKLSSGGVLGFHAPYLSVPNAKYSKEDIELAGDGMRKAILGLARLSSKKTQSGGDFIKKSLIQKVLENGPKTVFFVRTISQATRWDIIVFDAEENYAINYGTVVSMKNMCNNFHYANMDEDVPSDTNLAVEVDRYSSKFFKDDARVLVRDAKTSDVVCELYPRQERDDKRVTFHGCAFDYWSDKSFGDCRNYKTSVLFGKYIPGFFALDPNALLKQFEKR
jgi:hypothetical protein